MKSKNQDLYKAVLEKIANEVPLFRPLASMSDWEPAARSTYKAVYPEIKMYGCWFHYTQRIWAKAQKLGLSQGFRNDLHITTYIRQLMAIPFCQKL